MMYHQLLYSIIIHRVRSIFPSSQQKFNKKLLPRFENSFKTKIKKLLNILSKSNKKIESLEFSFFFPKQKNIGQNQGVAAKKTKHSCSNGKWNKQYDTIIHLSAEGKGETKLIFLTFRQSYKGNTRTKITPLLDECICLID